MKKGLLDLNKQLLLTWQLKNNAPHLNTALPTYQWIPQQQQQYLPSPTEPKSRGFFQIKEKYPMDGQHVLEGSHPG